MIGVIASSFATGGEGPPVEIVQHVPGTPFEFVASSNLNLSSTPIEEDVVVVRSFAKRAGHTTTGVSGLGATWTKVANSGDDDQAITVWVGTGANSSGSITISYSGSLWGQASATLVRGLASSSTVFASESNYDLVDAGPPLVASAGKFVVASAWSSSLTDPYPSATSPAAGWSADPVVLVPGLGDYIGHASRCPSSSGTHQATATSSTGPTGYHLLAVIG